MNKRFITSYVGFPSFFGAPIKEHDQVQEGMTVIAGVPIDQGVVTARPGARYGPRGIREASMLFRGAYEVAGENTLADMDTGIFLKPKEKANFADVGDFHITPTNTAETTKTVIEGVANIVRRGGLPVLLGGDHYVAYPGFAGFAKGMEERKSNPRIGYLHIDSHPDFRDEHGIGGKYTHGTQARRLSETSYITYKNMAWVGLNGPVMDPLQYEIFKSQSMKVLSASVVHKIGVADVVKEAMETAADTTDSVYVTIDIDVVDGSESPGTGALVYTGITSVEFLQMMDVLSSYDIIGAVDMCEVSPPLDHEGRTTHLAAAGLLGLLTPRIFDKVGTLEGFA